MWLCSNSPNGYKYRVFGENHCSNAWGALRSPRKRQIFYHQSHGDGPPSRHNHEQLPNVEQLHPCQTRIYELALFRYNRYLRGAAIASSQRTSHDNTPKTQLIVEHEHTSGCETMKWRHSKSYKKALQHVSDTMGGLLVDEVLAFRTVEDSQRSWVYHQGHKWIRQDTRESRDTVRILQAQGSKPARELSSGYGSKE